MAGKLTKAFKGFITPDSNMVGLIAGGEISSNGSIKGRAALDFTANRGSVGMYYITFTKGGFDAVNYLVMVTPHNPDGNIVATVTYKGDTSITINTKCNSQNTDSAFSFLIIGMQ